MQALVAAPPVETTIVSGPAPLVAPGTYSIVFFSQSRLATYQCRLDVNSVPGSWFSCDGQSAQITVSTPGQYTFLVQGTDELGQTDPTPAQRTFQV
jgi:hypothetical protein